MLPWEKPAGLSHERFNSHQYLIFVQGLIKAGVCGSTNILATNTFEVGKHLAVVCFPLIDGLQRSSFRIVITDNPRFYLGVTVHHPSRPNVGCMAGFHGMPLQGIGEDCVRRFQLTGLPFVCTHAGVFKRLGRPQKTVCNH